MACPCRDEIETLKSEVPVLEVADHLGLAQASNVVIKCPRCDSPLAMIVAQHVECRKCGFDGDAIDMIRHKEKMDFPAAVSRLADIAKAVQA